jgi:hypothetical protein
VHLLTKKNADINAKNDLGYSPLQAATCANEVDAKVIKRLLWVSGKVKAVSGHGTTPPHTFYERSRVGGSHRSDCLTTRSGWRRPNTFNRLVFELELTDQGVQTALRTVFIHKSYLLTSLSNYTHSASRHLFEYRPITPASSYLAKTLHESI